MRKENKLYKLDGIPPAARFYLAFSTEAWLKNLKLEEKKNLVSCQNLFWLQQNILWQLILKVKPVT